MLGIIVPDIDELAIEWISVTSDNIDKATVRNSGTVWVTIKTMPTLILLYLMHIITNKTSSRIYILAIFIRKQNM